VKANSDPHGVHGTDAGVLADFYLKKGFSVLEIEADPNLARACRERFAAEIAACRLTLVGGAVVDPETIRTRGQTIPYYAI
jgi:hypothetical protein